MNTCFSPDLPTVCVRGLGFADTDEEGLRSYLLHRLNDAAAHTVIFTPNAKIGADVMQDPELLSLFQQADLLLPDGAGVLLASRRHADRPLCHRLPGIEAGEMILALAAEQDLPVYFLGGKEGVAQAASERWRSRLPSLTVAGTHHGYFDPQGVQNDSILEDIRSSGAAVVLVCLGCPAQERWIVQNRAALPRVRLFIGLGGSFDVWAGRLRRAPRIFRTLRCEWLWRMLREPRRFAQIPAMLRYVFGR